MLLPGLTICHNANTISITIPKAICAFTIISPSVRDVCRASKARGHQLKFRISKRAHFGQVEALKFAGRTDPLANSQSISQLPR